jgi:hypothetical protein
LPICLRKSKQTQKIRTERRRSANQPRSAPSTSPPFSERPDRPVNRPLTSHSPSSYRDANPESLPWPHRYPQVSAVELTDEVIYNILREAYYEREVEPMNSFFECITRHLWCHRQKPTIPPLSLGVDLAQLEVLMIE